MPQIDEETPLLDDNGKQKITPLPWFQISIIIFLQLAEPLTGNVVTPFAPQVCCPISLLSSNVHHILPAYPRSWCDARERESCWLLCRIIGRCSCAGHELISQVLEAIPLLSHRGVHCPLLESHV